MQSTDTVRRNLLVGAAAAAVLFPLHEAVAQTAEAGGDWLDMVKAQHALIAATLEEIIDNDPLPGPRRTADLRKLGYLLTAHSVAEENVLYPALALEKLALGAAELYLEQDAQKVLNAAITAEAMLDAEGDAWLEKVKELQAAILKHAKDHEEGDLYPQLHERLTAQQNALVTASYQKFFNMVKAA